MAQWSSQRKTEAYLNANAQFATPDSRQIRRAKDARHEPNVHHACTGHEWSWSHPGDSKRTQFVIFVNASKEKTRKINHKNQIWTNRAWWQLQRMQDWERVLRCLRCFSKQHAAITRVSYVSPIFSISWSCSYVFVDIFALPWRPPGQQHSPFARPTKTATTSSSMHLPHIASLPQDGGTQSACTGSIRVFKWCDYGRWV